MSQSPHKPCESSTPDRPGALRASVVWIGVLLVGLNTALHAEAPASNYLQGLSKVGEVYIGPQPDAEALSHLNTQGVRTVISFRTPGEMNDLPFDQQQVLRSEGIQYHLIPTGGEQTPIGPDQVRQLDQLMNAQQGPVLMHCRSGYRAAVVLAAWLHQSHDLPLEDVIDAIADPRVTVDAVRPLLAGQSESP